ncbi:MAG: 50S ribosomal protein L22 [Candidatus Sericytochromatia bacterium]|nr:50S ribosomal protein L22 [Candidatus Sericytochromatia bacterium]
MEEVRAVAKYIRMTPRKMRRVVDAIRGKNAIQSVTLLNFMPHAAADVVKKALQSAIANASEKGLDIDSLMITKVFVDGGVTMKRIRPRAQGRAYPIKKRTSSVTLIVG